MWPVLVCADAGAKGELAPAPSSFIDSGGDAGFTMWAFGSGWMRVQANETSTSNNAAAKAPRTNWRPRVSALEISGNATSASAMCSHKTK